MDTNRLRQFQVLAETGNLRKAGELLGISHAGLSKSLRVLEDELQTRLTSRDGRGLRITPAGRDLLQPMKACLDAQDALIAAARGTRAPLAAQPLRIGTFEVFSTYLAPAFSEALSDRPLFFHELIPGKLESALVRGEVDFGITYLPVATRGLEHIEVKRIDMGVYALKGTPLARLSFDALPFVAPIATVPGSPTRVRGLDGWPDDRIPRLVRYEVDLMESAIALVRAGRAVAYLPCFIAELHNRVVRPEHSLQPLKIAHAPASKQPVYAIRRKDRAEDKDFKAVCRVLRGI